MKALWFFRLICALAAVSQIKQRMEEMQQENHYTR